MTPTGATEVAVAGVGEDLAGHEATGEPQSQAMEGVVGDAKELEPYPEGEVEPLKVMPVTCIAGRVASLTLHYTLKLLIIRTQPCCHLLALRPWVSITYMPSASVSSSV